MKLNEINKVVRYWGRISSNHPTEIDTYKNISKHLRCVSIVFYFSKDRIHSLTSKSLVD